MNDPSLRSSGSRRLDILTLAASAGLLTGLVEGSSFLLLQKLGWWGWKMAEQGVNREILWISPVLDFLLFCAFGLILQAAARASRVTLIRRLALAFFVLLMSRDWLLASGRIHRLASAMLTLGITVTIWREWDRCGEACYRLARRALPGLALLTLALIAGIQGWQGWQESRALQELPRPGGEAPPNVLVIVIDTLRVDHVGAYGYGRATTPTIDRLAREGVLFERAFSASSWTLPSHTSLLTGRYCFEHGGNFDRYDGRSATIADALRKARYRTGAFSANTGWFARSRGLGQGFIHFEDYTLADMAAHALYGRILRQYLLGPLGFEDWPGRKTATQVTDATLRWIEEDPGIPFFAFLNYYEVHAPYLPPAPYRTKFATVPNPGGLIFESADGYASRDLSKLTPAQLQSEVDAYDGGLLYADTEIGRLLDELNRRGWLQNTLVVVTSDHGEFFAEHGLFMHRNALYRPGVQVPLIFWGKAWGASAGTRVALPVSNASVPATILDTLRIPREPGAFPVPSLDPLLHASAPAEWPLPLMEISQMHFPGYQGLPVYDGAIKSLAAPGWQYIDHQTRGEELYRWDQDPRQEHNLAQDPAYAALKSQFREGMLALLHRAQIFASAKPPH